MSQLDSPVSCAIVDDIAIVTVNSPPVNALSQAVRAGLVEALSRRKILKQLKRSYSPIRAALLLPGLISANLAKRHKTHV